MYQAQRLQKKSSLVADHWRTTIGCPRHWPTYIDFRSNMPCSLAWLVAGRNTLEGRRYRTDCVVRATHSYVTAGQLPGRSSGISGELQAGGKSIRLCLTEVLLLWTPQTATLDSLRILSNRCLAPKFQHSLTAVTLGIYLFLQLL